MLMLMYVLYCTRGLHRESGSPRLSCPVGFGKWRGQSWWLDLGILRFADGNTEPEGMKRASIAILYVDGREDREREAVTCIYSVLLLEVTVELISASGAVCLGRQTAPPTDTLSLPST